jgi:saccharopine dehydrogenase-like NADP-dependent oxidoreductase
MKIAVLGAGAQGKVIAEDLARSLPRAHVTVADLKKPALPELPNLRAVEADLSSHEAVARLLHGHDLGVGALPSRFGFGAMKGAVEAKRPFVDVSFSPEDPLWLNHDAKRAGTAILPDCGLAPGLSHLLVGDLLARGPAPESFEILVGGVAQDQTRPYGYVVTWSLDDLMEEYTRPGRYVKDGKIVVEPVLENVEQEEIRGVGTMESFVSDGLRTLITTAAAVPDQAEKTLRWPGHVAAIKPLVASGKLKEEFTAKCTPEPREDLVVLVVRAKWSDGRKEESLLVDRYDPATNRTAMARTTAFTTSVTAQWVADRIEGGGTITPGVRPLELVAQEEGAVDFILGAMTKRGVAFTRTTP